MCGDAMFAVHHPTAHKPLFCCSCLHTDAAGGAPCWAVHGRRSLREGPGGTAGAECLSRRSCQADPSTLTPHSPGQVEGIGLAAAPGEARCAVYPLTVLSFCSSGRPSCSARLSHLHPLSPSVYFMACINQPSGNHAAVSKSTPKRQASETCVMKGGCGGSHVQPPVQFCGLEAPSQQSATGGRCSCHTARPEAFVMVHKEGYRTLRPLGSSQRCAQPGRLSSHGVPGYGI